MPIQAPENQSFLENEGHIFCFYLEVGYFRLAAMHGIFMGNRWQSILKTRALPSNW